MKVDVAGFEPARGVEGVCVSVCRPRSVRVGSSRASPHTWDRSIRDNGPPGSTWSVVFTEDPDFAKFVFDQALACDGKAHLWRAELIE